MYNSYKFFILHCFRVLSFLSRNRGMGKLIRYKITNFHYFWRIKNHTLMGKSGIKLFTVPNLITLLNLLCGSISVILVLQNYVLFAAILIFAAGVLDFLDGFAARLLKSYSDLGKSLDSLADMVSFGLAPSVIMYQLLFESLKINQPDLTLQNAGPLEIVILFSAFFITLFSGLRLAKFNIDERQSDSFIGVPTPANAFFIASIPFIILNFPAAENWILKIYVLLPLTFILSFLLVSEIPLISLKFKSFKFSDNKPRYFLVIISVLFIVILKLSAFPLIFIGYLTISVINNMVKTLH